MLKHACHKFLGLIGFFILAASISSANAVTNDRKLSPEEIKAAKQSVKIASSDQLKRVIVKYRSDNGSSPQSLSSPKRQIQLRNAQTSVSKKLRKFKAKHLKHLSHLPFSSMSIDAGGLKSLEADQNIEAIYEDTLRKPLLADSGPLVGTTGGVAAGATGLGQVVAIMDTGVDKTHSFLSGKVIHEACFSTTNISEGSTSLCPNGANSQIASGAGVACHSSISGCNHGTHVAGIAAGKGAGFSGIARDANIMAIQVFSRFSGASICGNTSPCLMSYTSDQLSALNHIYSQRTNYNIAAVNMSLGGGQFSGVCDDDPLKAAIDLLRSSGIATVIASGNDGFTQSLSAPACISTAISVGSTTKSDTVSSFSSSASFLDLLAPGSNINSSVPGGNFSAFSGTSMAAPHVAGAIAVLKSVNNNATVDQIENALKQTGQSITDSRNNLSFPRIDINTARTALTPPATPTLFVSPSNNLQIIGPVGGDFSPSSYTFSLRNITSSSNGLSYSISENANWLSVSSTSGSIAANGTRSVTVNITSAANNLPKGDYNTTLNFTNNTNGNGNTSLTITLSVTDDNDFFANAVQIGRTGETSGTISISNTSASRESNEPNHAKRNGSHSLWWKWVAPASGRMSVDTCDSDFDTVLAAYTGTSLNLLAETTSNDDACNTQSEISWDARAGVLYYIAVDGYESDSGNIKLDWVFSGESTPSPSISISPSTGLTFTGTSTGPYSPANASYSITNVGSSTQAISVNTPDWLSSSLSNFVLSPGAKKTVTFTINSNASQLPQGLFDGLLDFGTSARSVILNLTSGTLLNDDFLSAKTIHSGSQTISWNNSQASKQPGEPNHAGNSGGRSVWWKWIPTISSEVTISTEGSTFDTLLGIYTGNQLQTLNTVASDDDSGTGLLSSLVLNVNAGDAYFIAVDGFNGDSGQLKLNVEYGNKTVKHDFNADGRSDILWRNGTTGWNYLYYMDSFSITSNQAINQVPGSAWEIKGVGDFNGDQKADIFWRNKNTGENWIYLMDGKDILISRRLNLIDKSWNIAGTGDFDGDGKDDIVWRHANTGLNWIYLMNGHQIRMSRQLNKVADTSWEIKAVGDFDGDGKDDIVWRHANTGLNWIYLMNGHQIRMSRQLNKVADTSWEIIGAGDFDGDGRSDLFWRHAGLGINWIYLLNGNIITTSRRLNTVADPNWLVESIGDFNGDGLSGDILWRHQISGTNWLYLINGIQISLHKKINVVGTNWSVMPK